MKTPDPTRTSARARADKQETASCGGCSARWGGQAVCHCSGCHRTFTGVTAFDMHRRGGRCNAPEEVGLVLNGSGRWGSDQPMSADAIAARNGAS